MARDRTKSRFLSWCILPIAAMFLNAQTVALNVPPNQPQLLLSTNAYNPVPSSDGKYIAYVATAWGSRRAGAVVWGLGRSSLVTDVSAMDASGKVLVDSLAPHKFLLGWAGDMKAVVCYRDGSYVVRTINGKDVEGGGMPGERVAFLADINRVVWLVRDGENWTVDSANDVVARFSEIPLPLLVPSPNGRYIAMAKAPEGSLRVYDRETREWADIGPVTISPAIDWDYIEPSWDPWFRDSSRLVFFSGSSLVVSSPNGRTRQTIWKSPERAGLAAASPDGESVAFVIFKGRPEELSPKRTFWGNDILCVISSEPGSIPRLVTDADPDITATLHWLGNDALVFDRIGEELTRMHARIWKVAIR